MAKKYQLMNIDDVKDYLGIDSFREVTKDQVIQLVSSLHMMDPEVAKEALAQLPTYLKATNELLNTLRASCNELLSEVKKDDAETIKSFQRTLDHCEILLQRPDISISESMEVIDKEVEINTLVSEIREKQHKLVYNMWGKMVAVGAFALAVGASILGVSSNIKIPTIKKK